VINMSREELADILDDMAARVREGDSFEGHIEYQMAEPDAEHPHQVRAAYRVGNRMGQGGMVLIGQGEAPAPGDRLEQLRDRIQAEPGTWDGKRALAAYRAIGWGCTIGRARHNLKMVAERYPGLLAKVDGTRWTYTTASPATDAEAFIERTKDRDPQELEALRHEAWCRDDACPTIDGAGTEQQ
jgi:hypothetical protein